ncbi:MAG: glycosyltransferase family 2 protein [Leptospirales bacterium]|nr:glycosyltransferase family 2 protein [Leptospirales bacterium]
MNSQKAFFSIGIPTYDRLTMVREAIQSCRWQSLSDFTATVANDFVAGPLSADDLGIVDDPRFEIINRNKNLGPLANQNALMQAATGSYFIWLSDDDMYMPDLLAIAKRIIEEHEPECIFFDFIHGSTYPSNYTTFSGKPLLLSGAEFLEKYFDGTCPSQPWYGVWKREFIQEIGGMRQMGRANFSPYSDLWLALRAASARKIVYVPHPLVFFRTHETARSSVSVDLVAYTSGQEELLGLSEQLLVSSGAGPATERIRSKMMLRFVADYFEVLRRSGKTWSFSVLGFVSMIRKYLPQDLELRRKVKDSLNRELYRFYRERMDPAVKIIRRFIR